MEPEGRDRPVEVICEGLRRFVLRGWEKVADYAWRNYRVYGRGAVAFDAREFENFLVAEEIGSGDAPQLLQEYADESCWPAGKAPSVVGSYNPEQQVVALLFNIVPTDVSEKLSVCVVVQGPTAPPDVARRRGN